jgi:hypothetical protein
MNDDDADEHDDRAGGCGHGGSAADWPWPVLGRVTTFDGRVHVQEFIILGSSMGRSWRPPLWLAPGGKALTHRNGC